MPSRQDSVITPSMTLRRADVANAAMPMMKLYQRTNPAAQATCRVEVHEAFDRKLWAALDCTEQAHEKSLIAFLSE